MSTTVNTWWPALAPLPPELAHERLQVERHARVLRSIVAWHLMSEIARRLRAVLRIWPGAAHPPPLPGAGR
jgi:hypothetical protein